MFICDRLPSSPSSEDDEREEEEEEEEEEESKREGSLFPEKDVIEGEAIEAERARRGEREESDEDMMLK